MPRLFLLLTAFVAAPLHAAPLTFGEIDGTQDFSERTDAGACRSEGSGFDCVLARTSFGGLPLSQGRMRLDAWGRVRSLDLMLDRRDHDRAYALLAGRYGKPARLQPGAEWTRFDEGARISLRQGRPHALVRFDFPGNDAGAYDLRPAVGWSLLIFTLGGLAVGVGLRRFRRISERPVQPLSMKQTLDRRLSEGRDLSF